MSVYRNRQFRISRKHPLYGCCDTAPALCCNLEKAVRFRQCQLLTVVGKAPADRSENEVSVLETTPEKQGFKRSDVVIHCDVLFLQISRFFVFCIEFFAIFKTNTAQWFSFRASAINVNKMSRTRS